MIGPAQIRHVTQEGQTILHASMYLEGIPAISLREITHVRDEQGNWIMKGEKGFEIEPGTYDVWLDLEGVR